MELLVEKAARNFDHRFDTISVRSRWDGRTALGIRCQFRIKFCLACCKSWLGEVLVQREAICRWCSTRCCRSSSKGLHLYWGFRTYIFYLLFVLYDKPLEIAERSCIYHLAHFFASIGPGALRRLVVPCVVLHCNLRVKLLSSFFDHLDTGRHGAGLQEPGSARLILLVVPGYYWEMRGD